jgi:hypothetical protein
VAIAKYERIKPIHTSCHVTKTDTTQSMRNFRLPNRYQPSLHSPTQKMSPHIQPTSILLTTHLIPSYFFRPCLPDVPSPLSHCPFTPSAPCLYESLEHSGTIQHPTLSSHTLRRSNTRSEQDPEVWPAGPITLPCGASAANSRDNEHDVERHVLELRERG